MGIRIKTVVADHDLTFIGNMGGDSGDAGKAAHRIAAIQVLLDDILDYRTEIAMLLLETILIFLKELLEIIEEHPIKYSVKNRFAWDALFISQAIFVMTSSDVDDGRYILTTSGVRQISIDLAYQASPLLRFRGVSSMPSWRTPPSANETVEEFDNAVQAVHPAFGMA
jgi:hypothetical protein